MGTDAEVTQEETTPRVFSFGEIPGQEGGIGLTQVNGQDASAAVVSVQGTQVTEEVALAEPTTADPSQIFTMDPNLA